MEKPLQNKSIGKDFVYVTPLRKLGQWLTNGTLLGPQIKRAIAMALGFPPELKERPYYSTFKCFCFGTRRHQVGNFLSGG